MRVVAECPKTWISWQLCFPVTPSQPRQDHTHASTLLADRPREELLGQSHWPAAHPSVCDVLQISTYDFDPTNGNIILSIPMDVDVITQAQTDPELYPFNSDQCITGLQQFYQQQVREQAVNTF
jgi:hypothetical protein